MAFKKLMIGQDVDNKLRLLKSRTGLTPNLLCRLGFCLSLAEPSIPDIRLYSDGQVREFNRYTLTGQWDSFFFALLKERMNADRLDFQKELEDQFKAHLSRGVLMLSERVKSLEDLGPLVEMMQKKAR